MQQVRTNNHLIYWKEVKKFLHEEFLIAVISAKVSYKQINIIHAGPAIILQKYFLETKLWRKKRKLIINGTFIYNLLLHTIKE